MTSSTPRSAHRKWNIKYNWIIALVAIILAFALIFLYQWIWLPALFAELLSQGLPGTGDKATLVYFWTFVLFALPGVAVSLATLLWHFRPSRFSRVLVLIIATAWFVVGSTSGVGRRTGSSSAEVRQGILLRAGAELPVAEAWSAAIFAGSITSVLLGVAVGLFVLKRTLSASRRRKTTMPGQ